jgi:acyl-CoA reductase-like NAD-dependent aldehyde dehydrogenase
VPAEHEVACEELFGPVLTLFSFASDDEAVALANATDYGLVTGLWTRDAGRALALPKRLQSGQVFVNNYGAGGGVELPFGGMKRSGYGREKGFEGMKSFTTLKTVTMKYA